MKKIFFGIVIILLNIFNALAQNGQAPLEAFSFAFDAYRTGAYQSSATMFMRLAQDEPENELAPESLFMAAQAYFNAADYPTAYSACQDFLQKYPQHPKAADIEYQLGRILFKTNNYQSAVASFDHFLTKYPTDPLVSSALFWKAESYYQMSNTADALPLFEEIIARYPDSEKASLARWRLNVMGLEAREAKLLRIAKYESQMKASLDGYQFYIDAIKEDRYLKWHNAFWRYRQIPQTPAVSQVDAREIANNKRLSVLLEAKQKALNVLVSRIMEYLQGLSR